MRRVRKPSPPYPVVFAAIDQWQRTGWETDKNYIMVSNFVGGWRYEVRVVASNGGIYETGSQSVKIFPTATSSEYHELMLAPLLSLSCLQFKCLTYTIV